jgi:hypothetical protein
VNNTNEQDVVAITLSKRIFLYSALLDCVNLVQDGTIRAYSKIDGTNYRCIFETRRSAGADTAGDLIPLILGTNVDFKISYQASVAEGGAKNIPYRIVYAIGEL